jgi:predicted metal-dependent hydrolase
VEYDLVIKRSQRRKTVALRVLNSRTVELRAPHWVSDAYLSALLSKREAWLTRVLADCPAPIAYHDGATVLLAGCQHTLRWYRPQGRGEVCLVEQVIYLPVSNEKAAAKALQKFLRDRAIRQLTARCHFLAEQVGRKPSSILVRNFTARWGSCDSKGVIKLNWRLIMAPPDVQDYVMYHELAHMVEMNHSVHFWREVAAWVPEYKVHCAWLKQQGPLLLAV